MPNLMVTGVRLDELKAIGNNSYIMEMKMDTNEHAFDDYTGTASCQTSLPVKPSPPESNPQLSAVSGMRWSRPHKSAVRNDLYEDISNHSFLEIDSRKILTGVDMANAIAKLRLKGKTNSEIAVLYGIGQRQIERYKKVSSFPEVLKQAITNRIIKTTHGLALMKAYDTQGPDKVRLAEWILKVKEQELSVRQLTKELNRTFGKAKKQQRYIEKTKDGGFRLYAMRFDPMRTDETTKAKILEKLKTAVELLENQNATVS